MVSWPRAEPDLNNHWSGYIIVGTGGAPNLDESLCKSYVCGVCQSTLSSNKKHILRFCILLLCEVRATFRFLRLACNFGKCLMAATLDANIHIHCGPLISSCFKRKPAVKALSSYSRATDQHIHGFRRKVWRNLSMLWRETNMRVVSNCRTSCMP